MSEIPDADRIWLAHLAELRRLHPNSTITVLRRRGLARPAGTCTACGAPARPPARYGPRRGS